MSSRGAEPAKYALDTNIFINAFRDNAAANALDAFFRRALVVTFLSSVVVQELGAGARARKDALLLQRDLGPVRATESHRRPVGGRVQGERPDIG